MAAGRPRPAEPDAAMTEAVPATAIGFLGGGQLARMMAFEARRMGLRTFVLDPAPDAPAAQVADGAFHGPLDDVEAAESLAGACDVLTIDTELIPADLLVRLERIRPVRPGSAVLWRIQDRQEQRTFLDEHGLPHTPWAPLSSPVDLAAAPSRVRFPAVLKTRRAGYDGKGQVKVERPGDLEAAWESVGRVPCVVESFVRFQKEISVILVRALDGEVRFYPVAENEHRRHILHTTRAPAAIPAALAEEAKALGARIAEALGHAGVMAVEMFVEDGRLLVNEIAPRVHNSGHYTYGGCVTSQFEQHVRAICGLPLGDTDLLRPTVMVNLLGDLWRRGTPRWQKVLAHPCAQLHLYGKGRALPGRKMGHVLLLDEDAERAMETADRIVRELEADAGG